MTDIGHRVHVWSLDRSDDMGLGTCEALITVGDAVAAMMGMADVGGNKPANEPADPLLDSITPKIRLNSGTVVYGFECHIEDIDV